MAGKRKAEGIALLSLYNDEGDEEEEEEEEDEHEVEEEKEENLVEEPEQENKRHQEDGDPDKENVVGSRVASPAENISPPSQEDDIDGSPDGDRPGNSAHGIIVDYAHDDAAMSPDAEEGEIMSTGKAVLGSGMQFSNGFVQVATPPGTRNTSRPENVQLDDESRQLKANSPIATKPRTPESVDIEMKDKEQIDMGGSDADTLADFLPPPPVERCSQELQNKIAKFLALKNAGRSFNEELRKSKGYRNPDFLQRAVKYQEIDQIGSCFSKEIFDPHGYDASDFYDALALEFRREQERKEQAKKQSQRIEFAHGGVQPAPVSALADKAKSVLPVTSEQKGSTSIDTFPSVSQGLTATSEAAPKSDGARLNKKSKWDKVDSDPRGPPLLPTLAKSTIAAAASSHTAFATASAGGGYASFVLQKRKEAEERSRGSDKKSDRK